MSRQGKYLYSLYRNSDDRLLALDITASECAKIMGMEYMSFFHFLSVHNGRNGKWTVIKTSLEDIQADINS